MSTPTSTAAVLLRSHLTVDRRQKNDPGRQSGHQKLDGLFNLHIQNGRRKKLCTSRRRMTELLVGFMRFPVTACLVSKRWRSALTTARDGRVLMCSFLSGQNRAYSAFSSSRGDPK